MCKVTVKGCCSREDEAHTERNPDSFSQTGNMHNGESPSMEDNLLRAAVYEYCMLNKEVKGRKGHGFYDASSLPLQGDTANG